MKTVAIIQARLASTRLPGKVLLEVNQRPLLSYLVERVRMAIAIDDIVIATTENRSDDPIVKFCACENTKCFRGSEDDVLSRYYFAAKKAKADIIVRITSDCPLVDPEIIDMLVNIYKNNRDEYDFVANNVPLPFQYPDGMDVEVFPFSLLKRAHEESVLPSHREHVTFYMWQTGYFNTFRLDPEFDSSKYRLTVDYSQDFDVVASVLNSLYPVNKNFNMNDILKFLENNPKLLKLQEGIKPNSGWQKAFDKDRQFMKNK